MIAMAETPNRLDKANASLESVERELARVEEKLADRPSRKESTELNKTRDKLQREHLNLKNEVLALEIYYALAEGDLVINDKTDRVGYVISKIDLNTFKIPTLYVKRLPEEEEDPDTIAPLPEMAIHLRLLEPA